MTGAGCSLSGRDPRDEFAWSDADPGPQSRRNELQQAFGSFVDRRIVTGQTAEIDIPTTRFAWFDDWTAGFERGHDLLGHRRITDRIRWDEHGVRAKRDHFA